MEKKELVKYIDHTILSPDSKIENIKNVCNEAIEHGFKGVCINPFHVEETTKQLENTSVKTISVIGFPLGSSKTKIKLEETKQALDDGADEIDMVANIGHIKDHKWDKIQHEIEEIYNTVSSHNGLLKVIIETGYLTDEEKEKAAKSCLNAGANYVKTCTGFGPGQATVDDISLLHRIGDNKMKVKASGKIRTYEQALELIKAGASRIGASKSVEMIKNRH